MTLNFIVPGKIQGKQRFRFQKSTGFTYTPKETVSYEKHIQACYLNSLTNTKYKKNEFVRSCKLQVLAHCHNVIGKPDSDNILKVVMDALNGFAYEDDKVVYDVQLIKKSISKKVPEYLDITMELEKRA